MLLFTLGLSACGGVVDTEEESTADEQSLCARTPSPYCWDLEGTPCPRIGEMRCCSDAMMIRTYTCFCQTGGWACQAVREE